MPTFSNGQGTLILSLRKGETLVIRNYSGLETVTGSSAEREEAVTSLGAGAVVYGPQSVDSSITLSTSGQLDYTIVVGDPHPGTFTGTKANKFRAAIERSRSGGAPLLIAMHGDSNTAGAGAGTSTAAMVDARKWSVGPQLARILDRTFMYTTTDAFFGDQNCGDAGVTLQQYDPRFSALGAGWTQISGPTMGRRMFQGTAGGAGALTFTPDKPWNRVRILCGSNNTCAPTTNVKAGGSTIGNLNTFTSGPNALSDQTFSTGSAAAVQAFSLDGVAGGTTFLCGAIFWDSDNPGCVIVSGAWYGGFVSQLNDATLPWSPRSVAVALGAGLHITNATINDANSPTAVATYKASSLAFHQAIAASGDVLITGMTPSSTPSTGLLDSYEAALQEIASTIGSQFPLVDWRDQVGATYTAANTAGWMYDGNHLKGIGYARQAAIYASLIRDIAQGI